MIKLSAKANEEIRSWIYRNARPIEMTIWQYEFENDSKEAVLSVLSDYQNDDGGFGRALEPDSWNPNSSPYTTLNAINKLQNINFTDTSHPVMQGTLSFLECGRHSVENGWLFSIPSNNDYPHAPWLSFDPNNGMQAHKGVTAGLIRFALTFAEKNPSFISGLFRWPVKCSPILKRRILSAIWAWLIIICCRN